METGNHKLISDLSEKYADKMCGDDNNKLFSRGSIAAAYIIGAEETLHRVCNVISESAVVGGISRQQSQTLIRIIQAIEQHGD